MTGKARFFCPEGFDLLRGGNLGGKLERRERVGLIYSNKIAIFEIFCLSALN